MFWYDARFHVFSVLSGVNNMGYIIFYGYGTTKIVRACNLLGFSFHFMRSQLLCCFPFRCRQKTYPVPFTPSLQAGHWLNLCSLAIWNGQRNIHSTLLYFLGEMLKTVRGCPSRAKDKAQVSFLVTEEWNEIKWSCTLGGIMFLVICLSTNVTFLIIIRENQTWFHSRGRETLTAWNDRSPPSLHCHLFFSCYLDVMSTQYKKVYKNTRKS